MEFGLLAATFLATAIAGPGGKHIDATGQATWYPPANTVRMPTSPASANTLPTMPFGKSRSISGFEPVLTLLLEGLQPRGYSGSACLEPSAPPRNPGHRDSDGSMTMATCNTPTAR